MAQIKWTNTGGGNFNTGSSWMGGTVPGANDDALLTTSGTYTVSSTQNNTVKGIQIVQNVTLSIDNSSIFTATNGTDGGTNAGVIAVNNNSYFDVGGTLAGAGTIQLNSIGNGTELRLESNTTLSGGGKVVMSDNSQNYILTDGGPYLLTNVNDTISGAGQFAINNMSFSNGAAGILNANAAGNALVINAGTGALTNAGLMEATGNGGLYIQNSTITQTGAGTLKAVGAGHNISLAGASIVGGTLATTGGGLIQSVSDGYLTNVTIAAGSTVAALNNTYLHVNNTITNKGTIALDSGGNGTRLQIDSAVVTLTGGGKVLLDDNSQNYVYAGTAGYKLVNVNNTISGSGQFAINFLAVDNQAAGVINATGTASGLTINTGGSAFTNEGLIEDTGPAGLGITGGTTIVNTGTIGAFGAGAHIDLAGSATIQGGTLKTTGGGIIQSVDIARFDGATSGAVTIATGSTIAVQNNEYLYLDGTIVNNGTIQLNSIGNCTDLWIESPTVTLTGGGTVLLSDNTQNLIRATVAGNKLVNVNNTISGSGYLAFGGAAVDNQAAGIIDATGAAGLTINTGGSPFSNEGLIEATGAAGLAIGATTIVNTGTIGAFGAGSHIDLYANATIQGGLLKTTGGGIIQSVDTARFDGATSGTVTIAAGSTVAVQNNEYLYLDGTITNNGTIQMNSIGNGTDLWIESGTVTLTGGGTVLLSDNSQNYIRATVTGNKLVNVNNTISGSGYLAYGSAAIDNQAAGTINSTGAAGLTINNGGSPFSNEGLIEDTGTGGIGIGSTTILNTGTIAAFGAGSHVDLYSGADIQGGTLATSGGGVIQSTNIGTLDGSTAAGVVRITNNSQVAVQNNQYLYLLGTISNAGTIALNSIGNGTDLWIEGSTVTLTGGGTVLLSDNSQNFIRATDAGNKLVNFNNTITGAGQLTYGSLAFDNQANGTIEQTGANQLVADAGNQTFTNEGTLEAAGPGGFLMVNAALTNTGTIASLSDSSVTLASSVAISNYAAGTLTGGTWEAISAGGTHTSTLTLGTGPITTDAAHLVISGAGASIIAGGTSVLSTITTIAAGGELDILNGAGFTSTGTLTDTGTIVLSGSLSAAAITTAPRGLLNATGPATITTTGKLTNNGTLQASNGGTLVLAGGTLSSTGTVSVLANSSLTVSAAERNGNLAGGKLSRGTWSVTGPNATLLLASNAVTNDAAIITLSGAGSSFKSGPGSKTLETTLATVSAASQLNVLNNRGFNSTVAAGITNSGTIALGGATFGTKSLTITAGGTFLGGGTLTGPVTDNGALIASAAPAGSNGTLTVTGAIGGTGLISVGSATALSATAGFSVGTVSVGAAGTLTGSGSASGSVTVGGSLVLGTAGTLSAASLTIQPGGFVSGASIVTTGAISDNGTIALSGGTLSGSTITLGTANSRIQGFGRVSTAVTSSGTLDALGGTLTLIAGETGGTLRAEASSTLSAAAGVAGTSLTIAAGGSFIGSGSISGNAADFGTLTASGGTLALSTISGTGTAAINNNATLRSAGTIALSGGVAFASANNETLALGTISGNTAVISGFSSGTTIDLLNQTVTSIGYQPANGKLILKNGTTVLGQLLFAGTYSYGNFQLTSDGAGGTDVTYASLPAAAIADLHSAAASLSTPHDAGIAVVTPATLTPSAGYTPSLAPTYAQEVGIHGLVIS